MPAPTLTQDQIDLAVEMRERGRSCRQIALRLGVHVSTISWRMLVLGIDPPKVRRLDPVPVGPTSVLRNGTPVRRFTRDEDQRLLALVDQGLSRAQVAKHLGRQRNSVVARLLTLQRRQARQGNHA